ncbi:hypothetical protein [Streptomyces sp. NBC_01506]|uniref:hypothetical protein n=1 Tax=Streptomyces sp. NBC_01506 TaxID=2903887 RepID=UPI00386DBD2F
MHETEDVKLPGWSVATTWPEDEDEDEGVQDRNVEADTALGSTYGHARRSAEDLHPARNSLWRSGS